MRIQGWSRTNAVPSCVVHWEGGGYYSSKSFGGVLQISFAGINLEEAERAAGTAGEIVIGFYDSLDSLLNALSEYGYEFPER